MKKNISINLQGIIFHIEEDGFDVLSRYLAEVKAHFASYRGHEDIVADIEGRIAEIFGARLSPTKQIISLEDVEAMTAKMGRVRDFAPDADEDDEATETAGTTSAFGPEGAFGTKGPFGPQGPFGPKGAFGPEGAFAAGAEATTDEPRRLYRDMTHRKIAGVAAGLAQYFKVNSLWIRLGFLALFFLKPLVHIVSFGLIHLDINGGSAAFALFAYVILWIALPKHYSAPPLDDNFNFKSLNNGRKYFRDTDNGKIGGVAAGLAPYLNLDVTLIRVLLLAGLFAGGFTFLLYIILWIVAPQAKTVADRMRMRGEDMTLEGFDSNVRNNAFDGTTTGSNRPVGTFLEDLGRSLRPLVDFIGSAIRIVAGVMLTIVGISLLVSLAILLGAGIGLIPSSENIVMGDAPAHVLLNGIPSWGILAGFFAMAIPALALLLAGLNLLFRRSFMPRTVSLSLLGLWLLSIIGVTMATVRQSREFQYDAQVEQVERYPALTKPVLLLDARRVDRQWEQHVDVRLAALDSGKTVEVLRTLGAQGPSEEAARQTALTSIDYTTRLSGDSALVLDDHFSFLPNAKYRKQELMLTIRLPRDRTFRLSERFANNMLDDENFVNDRRPNNPEQHRYRLRGNKLECIECSADELGANRDNEDEDGRVNINIDTDNDDSDDYDGDDEDSDNRGTTLNYGGAPSIDTEFSSYGSGRRSFNESDFTKVSVAGGYRVVVRRGNQFKVEAGGDQDVLDDLRMERNGSTLEIKPRKSGSVFFKDWNRNEKRVLIRIEMPAIERLDLAGGIQADLGGFERQDNMRIEQAGASHLRLNGNYGTLRIEQAGACRTTATGHADALDLDAAGACELAAANLETRTADVDMAGLCKARLHVTQSIKGDVVGASEIAYSGKPNSSNIDASGPSSIKRL